MDYSGLIFIGAGLFGLIAAMFDWDWFMNSRKAQLFVNLLGRTGTRIFYGVLGGVLVVIGVLTHFGIMELGRRAVDH